MHEFHTWYWVSYELLTLYFSIMNIQLQMTLIYEKYWKLGFLWMSVLYICIHVYWAYWMCHYKCSLSLPLAQIGTRQLMVPLLLKIRTKQTWFYPLCSNTFAHRSCLFSAWVRCLQLSCHLQTPPSFQRAPCLRGTSTSSPSGSRWVQYMCVILVFCQSL